MAKLYDVTNLEELKDSWSIDNYDEYLEFFDKLGEQFFIDKNIYYERHHKKPKCEGGTNAKNNFTYLPFVCHMKAHFLRAKYWKEQGDDVLMRKHLYAIQANFSHIFSNIVLCEVLMQDKLLLSCASESRKLGFVDYFKTKKDSPSKGRVGIHRGNKNKFVHSKDLNVWLNKGWEKGILTRKERRKRK
jgi:hypothetical protein